MRERTNTSAVKRALAVLLCMLLTVTALSWSGSAVRVQAAAKSGLVKEGSSYYYYVKGKRIKNSWKTVKVVSGGKTVSYRYYFGSNGKAYRAPYMKTSDGYTKNVVAKKIGKYYYGFDCRGRMVKSGYYNNPNVFNKYGDAKTYYFDSKGRYVSSKSIRIQKAGSYMKDAKQLRAILGKPLKTKKLNSCFGEPGDDYQLNYKTVFVTLHRYPDGKEVVFGIFPR